MQIALSRRADKEYRKLPVQLQKQVDKQFNFLADNIRHPSLDAKKYSETDDIWQGRINRDYRFYFYIANDTYHILTIVPHPK